MYVGLRGGRRRSFGASSSKITATYRRLTVLKSSENLITMVKQCRELFCPSARKSPPADRPRKGLNHPLICRNIAGAVGISSLSWPCMYLGFLAMYRGMRSIKPYNSKIFFPAHPLKCTCWCQSRARAPLAKSTTKRQDNGRALAFPLHAPKCYCGDAAMVSQSRPAIEFFIKILEVSHNRL